MRFHDALRRNLYLPTKQSICLMTTSTEKPSGGCHSEPGELKWDDVHSQDGPHGGSDVVYRPTIENKFDVLGMGRARNLARENCYSLLERVRSAALFDHGKQLIVRCCWNLQPLRLHMCRGFILSVISAPDAYNNACLETDGE